MKQSELDKLIENKIRKVLKEAKEYKLGDKWSEDFDYKGMFITCTNVNLKNWTVEDMKKLYTSLVDVNYHTEAKLLDKIIIILTGDKSIHNSAEPLLKKFKMLVQKPLNNLNESIISKKRKYKLNEVEYLVGGEGDGKTSADIAKKHHLPEDYIDRQIQVGIAVEVEHVGRDTVIAKEITIDHLWADGHYYVKLVRVGLVDELKALQLYKSLRLNNYKEDGKPVEPKKEEKPEEKKKEVKKESIHKLTKLTENLSKEALKKIARKWWSEELSINDEKRLIQKYAPEYLPDYMRSVIYNKDNDTILNIYQKEVKNESINKLTKLIENITRKILKEDSQQDWYEVEYYAEVGQHGHADSFYGADGFKKAVNSAKLLAKRKNNQDLWYVGINSNTDTFAIITMTPMYLKQINERDFKDHAHYHAWMRVAKNVLDTNKPQSGKYPSSTNESILKEETFKAEDIVDDNVKEYYIKGSAKYSGDAESYRYSYKLKMPYEEGDTESSVENFLKSDYNLGQNKVSETPGQQYNRESINVTSKTISNKQYWIVEIYGRGGWDI